MTMLRWARALTALFGLTFPLTVARSELARPLAGCVTDTFGLQGQAYLLQYTVLDMAGWLVLLVVRPLILLDVTLYNFRVQALDYLFRTCTGAGCEQGAWGLILGLIGPLALLAFTLAMVLWVLATFAAWMKIQNPVSLPRVFGVIAAVMVLVQTGGALPSFYDAVRQGVSGAAYNALNQSGDALNMGTAALPPGERPFGVTQLAADGVTDGAELAAGMVYLTSLDEVVSFGVMPPNYLLTYYTTTSTPPGSYVNNPNIAGWGCQELEEADRLFGNMTAGLARVARSIGPALVGVTEQAVWLVLALGSVIVMFGLALALVPAMFSAFDALLWAMLRIGLIVIMVSFIVGALMGLTAGVWQAMLIGGGSSWNPLLDGVLLLALAANIFLVRQSAGTMWEAFRSTTHAVGTAVGGVSALDVKAQADKLAQLRGEKESGVQGGTLDALGKAPAAAGAFVEKTNRRFATANRLSRGASLLGGPVGGLVGGAVGFINPDFDLSRTLSSTTSGASLGTSVGALAGPQGAAVGGALGAVLMGGAEAIGQGQNETLKDAREAIRDVQRAVHTVDVVRRRLNRQTQDQDQDSAETHDPNDHLGAAEVRGAEAIRATRPALPPTQPQRAALVKAADAELIEAARRGETEAELAQRLRGYFPAASATALRDLAEAVRGGATAFSLDARQFQELLAALAAGQTEPARARVLAQVSEARGAELDRLDAAGRAAWLKDRERELDQLLLPAASAAKFRRRYLIAGALYDPEQDVAYQEARSSGGQRAPAGVPTVPADDEAAPAPVRVPAGVPTVPADDRPVPAAPVVPAPPADEEEAWIPLRPGATLGGASGDTAGESSAAAPRPKTAAGQAAATSQVQAAPETDTLNWAARRPAVRRSTPQPDPAPQPVDDRAAPAPVAPEASARKAAAPAADTAPADTLSQTRRPAQRQDTPAHPARPAPVAPAAADPLPAAAIQPAAVRPATEQVDQMVRRAPTQAQPESKPARAPTPAPTTTDTTTTRGGF